MAWGRHETHCLVLGLNNSEPWGPQTGQAIKAREGGKDGHSRSVRVWQAGEQQCYLQTSEANPTEATRPQQTGVWSTLMASQQPFRVHRCPTSLLHSERWRKGASLNGCSLVEPGTSLYPEPHMQRCAFNELFPVTSALTKPRSAGTGNSLVTQQNVSAARTKLYGPA